MTGIIKDKERMEGKKTKEKMKGQRNEIENNEWKGK